MGPKPFRPSLPLHVPAGTAPVYGFRDGEGHDHAFRFLVSGEQSGGSYSSMEVVSPQGGGPGTHVHDHAEEHFIVLEGSIDFQVGDRVFRTAKGDVVHVPRGCEHSFVVRSSQATTVAIYSPAGEEELLRAASVLIEDP
jgi:quercetin dioxygenase-like cupin family protein